MRHAIFSDPHSNFDGLVAGLYSAVQRGIESYFCCGDITGPKTNYSVLCIQLIMGMPNMTAVKGNHDYFCSDPRSIGELIEEMNELHGFPNQVVTLNPNPARSIRMNKEILKHYSIERAFLERLKLREEVDPDSAVVHATIGEIGKWEYIKTEKQAEPFLKRQNVPIVFCGHTHRAGVYVMGDGEVYSWPSSAFTIVDGNRYLINVGSVGFPNGDANNNYAEFVIYGSESKKIEFCTEAFSQEDTEENLKKLPLSGKDRKNLIDRFKAIREAKAEQFSPSFQVS